jgi:hypothetical protein
VNILYIKWHGGHELPPHPRVIAAVALGIPFFTVTISHAQVPPAAGNHAPTSPIDPPTFVIRQPELTISDKRAFTLRLKTGAYFLSEGKGREGHPSGGMALFEPEVSYSDGGLRRGVFNTLRLSAGIPLVENRDTNILPITLSHVHVGARSRSGITSYVGYGLGMYQVKVDTPETDRKQRWLFGGLIVVGADLGSMLVEAKYHIVSRYRSVVNDVPSSINVNGFQLTIGGRF